ncbi:MAG: inverse autotransporter beta domain-containing protein, partial [Simkaniaceae bacterium]|nr:inverse autotransporter beta domain-containing protein [Simkaniaceae bacterium]
MKKIVPFLVFLSCYLSEASALNVEQQHAFSKQQFQIQKTYEDKQRFCTISQTRLVAALLQTPKENSAKKFQLQLALKKIKVDKQKHLIDRNAKLLDLQKRVFLADNLDPTMQPQYIQAAHALELSQKLQRKYKQDVNLFAVASKRTKMKQNEETENPPSLVGLSYRAGRGVGYKRSYTSGFLFLTPNWERSFQPFLDARAHIFNNGRFASNLGGGLRFTSDTNNFSLGANLYYDFRSSKKLDTHQVGVGLESLFPYFDIRLNGYIPLANNEKIDPLKFRKFKGNTINVKRVTYKAIPTINAELGIPIPGDFCRTANVYVGVGPYYLFGKQVKETTFESAYGVKGRISAKFFDMLGLEFVISADRVYHTRAQGAISFTMPIGKKTARARTCSAKDALIQRTKSRPERAEIIPTKKEQKNFSLKDCNGKVLRAIFVNNKSTNPGCGTFEKPFYSFEKAQNSSTTCDDLVYVFRGDGTTNRYDTGYTILEGQRLQGSGQTFYLNNVKIPDQTCGNPTIIFPENDVIKMENNSTIDGFNIQHADGNGIKALNKANLTISSNDFSGSLATGASILIESTGFTCINSNTFTGNSTANGQILIERASSQCPTIIANNTHRNYSGLNSFAIKFIDTSGGPAMISNNCITTSSNTTPVDIVVNTTAGSVIGINNNKIVSNATSNIGVTGIGGTAEIISNVITRKGTPA